MNFSQPELKASRQENSPGRITLRPQELADSLGVTRRYLYKLMKHPDTERRLPKPIKIGRVSLWRVEDVRNWLDRQSA